MNTQSPKEAKTEKRATEPTSAPAAAAASGAPADFASATPGADWLTYNTNRKIYKPDLCHEKAVKGYLLDYLEMPAVDGDREWNTYVIKLTHPTLACDREGNVSRVEAGEEIMVPEVYDLQQCVTLKDACMNPDETYEVYLKPINREKIGGGKTLWRYDIKFTPKAIKRTGALKLFVPARKPAEIAQGSNPAAAPPPFTS